MDTRIGRKPLVEIELAQLKVGSRVTDEEHVELLRDRPDEIDDPREAFDG